MRWLLVAFASFAVAACSGSEPTTSEATALAPTSTVVVIEPPATNPDTGDSPSTTVVPGETTVEVEVRLDSEDATITGTLDDSVDPFGEFVSCSGVRATFSTYAVLVATTSGRVRSVSATTAGVVVAAGIHDAAVRVELDDGTAIDATGTITLQPGFQSGSFIAFDSDGRAVEGTFACRGTPEPNPLDIDDDGVLDAIDAIALLRAGDASRLVGFAVGSDSSATFDCPGGDGSDVVAVVDGDGSIGAMTSFELTGGDQPTLTMRVGAIDYVFDSVTLGDTNSPAAGSFSAEADGLAVDGAYRCS